MSFGYSTGDIIVAVRLAKKIASDWRHGVDSPYAVKGLANSDRSGPSKPGWLRYAPEDNNVRRSDYQWSMVASETRVHVIGNGRSLHSDKRVLGGNTSVFTQQTDGVHENAVFDTASVTDATPLLPELDTEDRPMTIATNEKLQSWAEQFNTHCHNLMREARGAIQDYHDYAQSIRPDKAVKVAECKLDCLIFINQAYTRYLIDAELQSKGFELFGQEEREGIAYVMGFAQRIDPSLKLLDWDQIADDLATMGQYVENLVGPPTKCH